MNNLILDLGKIVLIAALYFWLNKKMEPIQIVKTGITIFIILAVMTGLLLIFNWLAMKEHPLDSYFTVSFIDFVLLLVLANSFYALKKKSNKYKTQ